MNLPGLARKLLRSLGARQESTSWYQSRLMPISRAACHQRGSPAADLSAAAAPAGMPRRSTRYSDLEVAPWCKEAARFGTDLMASHDGGGRLSDALAAELVAAGKTSP